MTALRITTIQAPIQDIVMHGISEYLAEHLGIGTEFVVDVPWQERERRLDEGQVQIAWICGLPYVKKVGRGSPALELLVAPVMNGERYQDRPIYFSDVIVRAGSAYERFEDLRGARWAYNEPHSHSGHNITLATLAAMRFHREFFGTVIEAGSHANSIEMVMDGRVDAAAIDSTVLELARDSDERIGSRLHVLTALGPSPIPPLVILKSVEAGQRENIRTALSGMHRLEDGRRVLEQGKIKRLQVVSDESYNPIRRMARAAESVRW